VVTIRHAHQDHLFERIAMRLLLVLASLVASPVLAQTAPPPATTPVPAPAAPTIDSAIGDIANTPEGKAVIDKHLPNLLGHPSYEQFKGLSLKQVQPYSNGAITDEQIAAIEAELKSIKR
jgi:hypothetical protein